MHVLIVPSWYPTISNPIAGIFFKEQAQALQSYGHQVTVAFLEIWSVTAIGEHKTPGGISVETEDGLTTYRYQGYNLLPKIPGSAKRLYYKKLKKMYEQIVKEQGKPDLIHAHCCLLGGWAGAKLGWEIGIPAVVTEHSSAFTRNRLKPDQKKFVKEALGQAAQVIAVGPGIKKELSHYVDEKKIKLIPNIVNTEFFKPGKLKKNHKFRFFSVASLIPIKGMDLLLKAFGKYFNNKEVELIIGGDGKEKGNLEELSKELGIENQVCFIGKLSREEVKEQMQQCDVFVLASRMETFGVVYIEALACGKPIVATACGGPEMIVNQKNGLLVPVEEVDSLGKAMESIANTIEEYDYDVIREDCLDRFGAESVTEEITEIYKNLIRKNEEKKTGM